MIKTFQCLGDFEKAQAEETLLKRLQQKIKWQLLLPTLTAVTHSSHFRGQYPNSGIL